MYVKEIMSTKFVSCVYCRLKGIISLPISECSLRVRTSRDKSIIDILIFGIGHGLQYEAMQFQDVHPEQLQDEFLLSITSLAFSIVNLNWITYNQLFTYN